jgi:nucleoside-diphosphate-sugar epimerase
VVKRRGEFGGEHLRVLVTGHDGYIGVVLVSLLRESGHEVVGLDSGLFRDCTFGPEAIQVPSMSKDIRDVVASELEGFDAVLHLAGISNDPLGDLNPECTLEINHRASVRLAEKAKEAGVPRFIFSSSCSTYGAAGDDLLDEQAEFNPVTSYGVSKVRVEQDVARLADDNFSPIFLRNATAYGVSCRLRADLVLNNLVGWAFTTGRVLIKSDGTPWRPIVHIEDISRAFVAALEAPRQAVHGEAFNVGITEENYRVRELAEIVRETVPNCRVEYAEGAGPDKRCYRVDCSKVRKILPGFKPQWNARRGAEQLYRAYREIGLTLEDLEGAKYMRIQRVRLLQESGCLDSMLRWVHQSSAEKDNEARLSNVQANCSMSIV